MNKKIDKKMIINVVAAVAAYIVVMILINGGILGR